MVVIAIFSIVGLGITFAADEGVTYLVVTDVTVQSSKARKVTVMVTSNTNSARGGRAYLESSFALWGRR